MRGAVLLGCLLVACGGSKDHASDEHAVNAGDAGDVFVVLPDDDGTGPSDEEALSADEGDEGDDGSASAAESDLGKSCTFLCAEGSACLSLEDSATGFCSPSCVDDADCAFAGPGEGRCVLRVDDSQVADHCGISCPDGVCPAGLVCDGDASLPLCLPESNGSSEPTDPDDPPTPPRPPFTGTGDSAAECNGTGTVNTVGLSSGNLEDLSVRTLWFVTTLPEYGRGHMVTGYTRPEVTEISAPIEGREGEQVVFLYIDADPSYALSPGTEYGGLLDLSHWNVCEWESRYATQAVVTIDEYVIDPDAGDDAWCIGRLRGHAGGYLYGSPLNLLTFEFTAPALGPGFPRAEGPPPMCECTPDCTGRSCGDDGCGGSCGACGEGQSCSSQGRCACVPECDGKSCGDDGCGGTCGSCPSTHVCSEQGRCTCTPSCDGKSCGDDGCGGTCGYCGLGTTCSGGSCVDDPDSCDPVLNLGCDAPNECWLLSNEETRCALTGSGTQGASCSAANPCAGGHGCFAGKCRKICSLASGAGCADGITCTGVSGWRVHGACGTP